MELTIGSAIFLTLLATFLFAFWYQALKHLGEYPLAGFVMWLYISSFITILAACRVLGAHDMPAYFGRFRERSWPRLVFALAERR